MQFFYAKPLFIGTLQEVLKFPNTFETTLPKLFGHPSNQKNIAEGLVLKPIKNVCLSCGKRLILKNKPENTQKSKTQEKKKLQKFFIQLTKFGKH